MYINCIYVIHTYGPCGLSVCGHVVLLVWDISFTVEKIPLKDNVLLYCASLPCDLFAETPFLCPISRHGIESFFYGMWFHSCCRVWCMGYGCDIWGMGVTYGVWVWRIYGVWVWRMGYGCDVWGMGVLVRILCEVWGMGVTFTVRKGVWCEVCMCA